MLTLFAAEVGEEAAEAANPILPVSNELFWGALCFFALWALVKYVLLPPAMQAMADRASAIRTDLDAADEARASAGSAATEVHDQLADVRAEASEVVEAARVEAEAERAQIIAAAQVEVDTIHAAADAEIQAAQSQALSGVHPQIAALASQAAARVMDRPIDAATSQPAVTRFLENPN